MSLEHIKTIFLVMFENRSFDHMLGHLSYDNLRTDVNGLKKPLGQYGNIYKGDAYPPFKIRVDSNLTFDIPHEYNEIAVQLAKSQANGHYAMNGFVKAYLDKTKDTPNRFSPPMGFFKSDQVPITSFLANTFTVCDSWHAPLPTSTQPNRTMAFMGDSTIHETKLQLIKADGNIFDWLTAKQIKWRVYHDGLSFFVLYDHLWPLVLGDRFKDYENLFKDMQDEEDETFPQVIVIEPSYFDSPHLGSDLPNDNHAPLAIGWGEEFLRRTYEAVIANSERWANSLMIVYYDEHGGFYDHQPPPLITYDTKETAPYHFESLGPRIPGILISPYAPRGTTSSILLDHTSVLQLLAEKFSPGTPYSATVENRRTQGIQSISKVLVDEPDVSAPAPPQQPIFAKSFLGDSVATAPVGNMGKSFESAALQMMEQKPTETALKYPELFQWKDAVEKHRTNING